MPAAMCPASAAGETAAASQQASDTCPARLGIDVQINVLLRCCRVQKLSSQRFFLAKQCSTGDMNPNMADRFCCVLT